MPAKANALRTEIVRGASIEAVFLKIREMIVYGRLAPGSWIVEGDIAEKLGVSRTPVRHALQWLEHEGYLVALGSGPKSRMTVASLTESDAIEAYRIVGHMEGLAGRLAADLPKRERSELIKKLRHLNGRMQNHPGRGNPTRETFSTSTPASTLRSWKLRLVPDLSRST